MGVPGFFAWLLRNKKKLGSKNLIQDNIQVKIKYLMLDTNCLLHPCVNNILGKYKNGDLSIDNTKPLRPQLETYIWNLIENYINDMIEKVKPEILFVAIDGVAPIGKVLQQRQRRYRYLFDKQIKLNTTIISGTTEDIILDELSNGISQPQIPISSIELTPGTDYMERIHENFNLYMEKLDKRGIKYIYSSYHEEGEGEHKILQYIKKNLKPEEPIIIYGLDADLLFLSLGIGFNYDLYIMREKQIFDNKEVDLDDYPDYNYVEIKQLHRLIEHLDISTPDFIVLCYLMGNDFLPGMLTLDFKKGGLDKIIKAFHVVINKLSIKIKDDQGIVTDKLVVLDKDGEYDIDHELFVEVLRELAWTEKHIWKNINRDVIMNQWELTQDQVDIKKAELADEKKSTMLKFIIGMSDSTEGLNKIEFSSDREYYQWYLGLNGLDIDKTIIIKMVKDYITGIIWCVNYYLDECKSWSWGYNFMVAPLIKDMIQYYPNKIVYKKTKRNLHPVEQLILAIPPETYKYVIEKDIIQRLQSNKKIGYMFPISYELDVNKEKKFWKCQVRIPMVEYEEYIKEIKSVKIEGKKNQIISFISNIN